MESKSFELSGKDIGPRTLDAIVQAARSGHPILLDCSSARFREHVIWENVEFAELNAEGCKFERGFKMIGCTVNGDAQFGEMTSPSVVVERCTFDGLALWQGATVKGFDVRATSFEGYTSFDRFQAERLSVRATRFMTEARFRAVTSRDIATFKQVTFSAVVSLHNARSENLRFRGCDFFGAVQLHGARAMSELELTGCVFRDCRRLELSAGNLCEMKETRFEQPVTVISNSPALRTESTSFERGLDLSLAGASTLSLTETTIEGLSLISTEPGSGQLARLETIRKSRLSGLTLERLDLSVCRFGEAHALDDLLIRGPGQLLSAPRSVKWLGQREVIADECDYRFQAEERHPNGIPRWSRSPARDPAPRPHEIAETYRSLRRGREIRRDEPGATDFYYGEMEMRRRSGPAIDRVLLAAYWGASGYGTRFSRAATTYIAFVALAAAALCRWGVDKPTSFGAGLRFILASTTIFEKAPVAVRLTAGGTYLQFAARVFGPALFGLMILTLRARVKR